MSALGKESNLKQREVARNDIEMLTYKWKGHDIHCSKDNQGLEWTLGSSMGGVAQLDSLSIYEVMSLILSIHNAGDA